MKNPPLVLVADDETDYLEIASRLLEEAGLRAARAATGAECLAAAAAEKPGLIVLDIGLPDMSGLDVLKSLKSDPALKEVPVLLFTVRSELDYVSSGLAGGAAGYVIKPFRPEDFVRRVRSFFG
ncbi:MAG: response regulator [Elusimicrobiales bacterium]|nr:response regulator [Elusimicrobiales bacterium]